MTIYVKKTALFFVSSAFSKPTINFSGLHSESADSKQGLSCSVVGSSTCTVSWGFPGVFNEIIAEAYTQ